MHVTSITSRTRPDLQLSAPAQNLNTDVANNNGRHRFEDKVSQRSIAVALCHIAYYFGHTGSGSPDCLGGATRFWVEGLGGISARDLRRMWKSPLATRMVVQACTGATAAKDSEEDKRDIKAPNSRKESRISLLEMQPEDLATTTTCDDGAESCLESKQQATLRAGPVEPWRQEQGDQICQRKQQAEGEIPKGRTASNARTEQDTVFTVGRTRPEDRKSTRLNSSHWE